MPARVHDAIALIRTRTEQLAAPGEREASWFVTARDQVLAEILADTTSTGPSALADLAEKAVALGRPVGGWVALAEATRTMTLAKMTRALGKLRLARAAVWVTGPRAGVEAARAVLGAP